MTPPTAPVPTSAADQAATGGPAAALQWLAFVDRADDPRPAILTLPPGGVRAVVVGHGGFPASDGAVDPPTDLGLLVVPATPGDAGGLPPEAVAWVEAAGPAQQIALHGAVVAWSPRRAAVLVEPGRLEAVRAAVVEFAFHDRELAALEAAVAAGWSDVEADAPLAFEFRDRDAGRRAILAERFRSTVALRSRLVRLAPHLDRPPLHPPTLASQVGERLRERSRMAERAGFLDGQLAARERVYDLCAERSSDWALARKSTTLEWVIIALLAVETVLILVDLLVLRGA